MKQPPVVEEEASIRVIVLHDTRREKRNGRLDP